MQYKQFITDTLQKASKIAIKNFGNVTGTTKEGDNNQVLTETDIAIGNFIIAEIKKIYPDYNIIDEEAGVIDNDSAFTWVVDPIDGTSNFANGVPTYGIMFGLLKEDTPIAGGFVLPSTGEICVAEKGKGAFLNGQKISVTKEEKLSNCLVAYHIDGHPDDEDRASKESQLFGEIIKHIRNMRSTGCEPWDALYVATGKYGALVNQTMKIWDVVAVQIVIEESGGMYTDYYGKPIAYSDPLKRVNQNFTSCAASPVLHKQLQSIIQASNQG